MPQTMWACREAAVQGVGLGLLVPNGQGLAVPPVGVGDMLPSPCPPHTLASAWGGTVLWVTGSPIAHFPQGGDCFYSQGL